MAENPIHRSAPRGMATPRASPHSVQGPARGPARGSGWALAGCALIRVEGTHQGGQYWGHKCRAGNQHGRPDVAPERAEVIRLDGKYRQFQLSPATRLYGRIETRRSIPPCATCWPQSLPSSPDAGVVTWTGSSPSKDGAKSSRAWASRNGQRQR
jgi:hypothetical protein